jgi:hypothetical protein
LEILEQVQVHEWAVPFSPASADQATKALEAGKVLFAQDLPFALTESEQRFLSPEYLSGAKNISFNHENGELSGTASKGTDLEDLTAMVRRFSVQAVGLMRALCPAYGNNLVIGRTSFRPAEIAGRASSWRKDDTRLHVDAFPSRPIQGNRIVRVFANVSPSVPRVWRVGEPFGDAARKLLSRVRAPFPGSASLLSFLNITKGRRTPYDHYMLGLHDAMKSDTTYQAESPQTEVAFPPGATWVCFTDSVSHAAMSGKYAFEQTFYLPVNAMRDPGLSPLKVLEGLLGKPLV